MHDCKRCEWLETCECNTLCAPGDNRQPHWILRFCDNDVRDMHFTDEDEAHARWQFHCGPSGNLNGTLYQVAAQRKPMSHDEIQRFIQGNS